MPPAGYTPSRAAIERSIWASGEGHNERKLHLGIRGEVSWFDHEYLFLDASFASSPWKPDAS